VPFCYCLSVSLYWLCYQREGKVEVVLQAAASLIGARMQVGIAKLDQGSFAEGHALDKATGARVPAARPTGAKKSKNGAEQIRTVAKRLKTLVGAQGLEPWTR
jgi:hypothetical protein